MTGTLETNASLCRHSQSRHRTGRGVFLLMFLFNGRQLACDISAFPRFENLRMSHDVDDAFATPLWRLDRLGLETR
ncbi:hypothetical protein M419DRAFT_135153 [Trichoderma reesei RUT C-30]|uniref:Uncharacterized protein n=1 Tax=Hypocrea jecorina (strain ATCC 56765 / BCRC 32924 / NRRL 11460 / Rut C-30) TaxID=1344414 RepID=A0A024RU71_HYPJR|nr:hypothetical protein M419DRAFT_135153 [Trichoderma reesei RUT C-30]